MMNSEQALRAAEDFSIYRDVSSASNAKEETKQLQRETTVLAMANNKIDELRNLLKIERQRTEELTQKNNAAVVFGQSAAMALKDATEEIAALKKTTVEAATKPININRTKHFNNTVKQFLKDGHLTKDPRITHNMGEYPWFVPGLDG